MLGHSRMHGKLSDWFTFIEHRQIFIQPPLVVHCSVSIREANGHTQVSGAAVRQIEDREKPPGLLILAPRLPVVAEQVKDARKALLRHSVPAKTYIPAQDRGRRFRQSVEIEICDDTEVAATSS